MITNWLLVAAPTPTVMFRFDTRPPLLTCNTLPVARPKPIVRFWTAPVACQTPWFATVTTLLDAPPPIVLPAPLVNV